MDKRKSNNLQHQSPINSELVQKKPQAVEIEKALLGALLIDSDAFTVVSELISPETFWDPRHQKIYNAIQTLNVKELPVDYLTVMEEMKREGTYDEVGAPAYIIGLTENVMSSANIEHHASILRDKYLAREIIEYSSRVATEAYDEGQDIQEVMQRAETDLFGISQKSLKQDYTQIDSITRQVYSDIYEAMAKKTEITGVPSGYANLDKITLGFHLSDLIILAGRTSMGKTAFAVSMAKNMAVDNKISVGFFSLEMSSKQLVGRLISNVCSIEGTKIINGQMLYDEIDRLEKNVGTLLGVPLFIDDSPGITTTELRIRAKRLVREHGVKIIFIDYLQLLKVTGERYSNEQERVATISSSLKALGKEINIPIVALSQLNRGVEHRDGLEGKRPQLSDLRSSGSIEQDADLVLLMFRPEYYGIYNDDKGNDLHNMAEAIIPKNRKGKTGTARLVFRGEYTRFENIEDNSIGEFPIDDYEN